MPSSSTGLGSGTLSRMSRCVLQICGGQRVRLPMGCTAPFRLETVPVSTFIHNV